MIFFSVSYLYQKEKISFCVAAITYESSVGLQTHDSAFSHTARGREGGSLAVVLEISKSGSDTHTHETMHKT